MRNDFIESRLDRNDVAAIARAIGSYDRAMREEFGRDHDHFCLIGK